MRTVPTIPTYKDYNDSLGRSVQFISAVKCCDLQRFLRVRDAICYPILWDPSCAEWTLVDVWLDKTETTCPWVSPIRGLKKNDFNSFTLFILKFKGNFIKSQAPICDWGRYIHYNNTKWTIIGGQMKQGDMNGIKMRNVYKLFIILR